MRVVYIAAPSSLHNFAMDLRAHATAVSTQNAYIRAKAFEALPRFSVVYTSDKDVKDDCVSIHRSGTTLVGVVENDVVEGDECAVATSGLVTVEVTEEMYNSNLPINAPVRDSNTKCIGTFARRVQPNLTTNGLKYYVRVMLSPWVNAMPKLNSDDFREKINTLFGKFDVDPPSSWDECKDKVMAEFIEWLKSKPW